MAGTPHWRAHPLRRPVLTGRQVNMIEAVVDKISDPIQRRDFTYEVSCILERHESGFPSDIAVTKAIQQALEKFVPSPALALHRDAHTERTAYELTMLPEGKWQVTSVDGQAWLGTFDTWREAKKAVAAAREGGS
jgi:hypothetical protein